MAKAVNVKNTSSGKAVVVKIEGGGGGGGDAIKTVSFAEAISNTTYTLTNAADVFDMLEDVLTEESYPMDAAVKYKVAFQSDSGLESTTKYASNAWLNYDSYPGQPASVNVSGEDVESFIVAGVVDGSVVFGVNPGTGVVFLTREDIDPSTGTLTKDFSGD